MNDIDDPIYPTALSLAKAHGTMSVDKLQNDLHVGYNRACRLLERIVTEKHLVWSDPSWKRAVSAGDDRGTG